MLLDLSGKKIALFGLGDAYGYGDNFLVALGLLWDELKDKLNRQAISLSLEAQQKLCIARLLPVTPAVLLMDEPLSNLDAELRHQMRAEIRRLHETLGTTTVYVTHDQIEAMTLADRIAILDGGELQQHGAPLDVYNNPANDFVKGFLCKHIDEIVETANNLFPKE